VECLYLLARAYAEYSAALLDRVLREAPESAAAHRLRAEDALSQGMPRAAAVELRQALAKRPADVGLQRLLVEVERAAEADSLPAAVRIDGPQLPAPAEADDPDALYLLGKAYHARSSEVGHRLFELHPNSYRVRLMRGEAFEKAGRQDYANALEEYRAALKLNPHVPGAHYAIGRILWKLRRWDEALPYLEKELAGNPHHALANYYLGSSHLSLGAAGRAIPYLEAALRARPDLTQARRDLGKAHARNGNYDAAIASYRRALETDPDDAGLHALLAVAYRASGQIEDARRSAEMARELGAQRNQPVQ
jgi:tetratricopeptide (TPR) repeat protein